MNTNLNDSIDTRDIYLGMGQMRLVRRGERVICFLGSCVAVSLYSPIRSVGAVSHVVLGHARGRGDKPAKFADRAIDHMLECLGEHGCAKQELQAGLCGGASLLRQGGPFKVGKGNSAILKKELARHGIPLIHQDLGGARSRRVVFDGATGTLQTTFGESDHAQHDRSYCNY